MNKERDYLELERLSRKLRLPVLSTHIKVTATKDGRVTAEYKGRCHTWTRNYWNWAIVSPAWLPLVITNFGAGYLSMKRDSGVVGALSAGSYPTMLIGVVNNSNYGIVVGTGSGAEDFEGYQLTTPVVHGVAAGNLSHRAQAATAQEYTEGTLTWKATLTRFFDNLSGGTITITEAAIKGAYSTFYYMMCRDLLAASVDVLNNGILTVTYEMSLVFPA